MKQNHILPFFGQSNKIDLILKLKTNIEWQHSA